MLTPRPSGGWRSSRVPDEGLPRPAATGDTPGIGSRVSSSGLIGRDPAREVLAGLLDLAAAGQPRIALVVGEAGIGKTRLLAELEARAGERGFVVLHGEAVEFGGDELPYAPVVGALRQLPRAGAAGALEPLPGEAREALGALLPPALQRSAPADS